MRIILSLIAIVGLGTQVFATTWHQSVNVQCPIDGSTFKIQRSKTQYFAPIDKHIRRPTLEPIYTCPRCHWTGGVKELNEPLSFLNKAAILIHLSVSNAPKLLWERYRLAAEISSLSAKHGHVIGTRYLAAARAAGEGHQHYVKLRKNALMALRGNTSKSPATLYAIAELTRQLELPSTARDVFQQVLKHPKASQRLKKWCKEALDRP